MRRPNVIAFGAFDLLHPGHVAFLRRAARLGALTVVVTPDAKVRAEKGRPPMFSARERMAMVAAVREVGRVVLGDDGPRWTVVARLRPDVIAVGHDQRTDHPAFLAQIERLPRRPRLVRIPAYRPGRYKSSLLKTAVYKSQGRAFAR